MGKILWVKWGGGREQLANGWLQVTLDVDSRRDDDASVGEAADNIPSKLVQDVIFPMVSCPSPYGSCSFVERMAVMPVFLAGARRFPALRPPLGAIWRDLA